MSIKKSLRLSIILLASLPLVFLTLLMYSSTRSKYLELARNSAESIATSYADGFHAQLEVQVAEAEGLARTLAIQNILIESYNNISLGTASSHYESVMNAMNEAVFNFEGHITYYIYDKDGFFIASTSNDSSTMVDWQEYMNIEVSTITETNIMSASNINKDAHSIEILTPVKFKDEIIGLIRANISVDYFGTFLSDSEDAFILTGDNSTLFNSTGFSEDNYLSEQAELILGSSHTSGHISKGSSFNKIYGYSKVADYDWFYIIKQEGTEYQKILSSLPITLCITLFIIILISIHISNILAQKYTEPIITLKDNMTEAAAGNLDLKCEIDSEDEFGELSDMFNNMMNIISNNYNQLNESKKQLELNELELKKNYAHIEQLAYHDGLTGLYNRVAFMKYAYDILHKNGSQLSTRHAIFFLDLDNFKNVNDTLGHDYGDILLKQVSMRLNSTIELNDLLARTGGDEFLILKSSYNSVDELDEYANKLVQVIREPYNLDGETANVSLSVGIALFPRDGLTTSELIKNSDIAMYNAKTSGKNSYKFFNSYMEDDFNRRNDLAEILSNVIPNNEIYLQYQPQINVSTGQITGFEALMRIESELIGFIPPSEFIPIAEDSGVINQLGEWALYEACSFNHRLAECGYPNLRVSVNVSTTQLQDSRLIKIIKSIPEKTGMDLKNLEIEITESVLMNSFEHNLDLINQIKSLGASIALDDFGTGYSSFNYLTQIPIDTLKIDKSFIDGICSNEKDRYIADSIISLAHKMKISVVAEGVEDVEQLKILQHQLCDTLQGYLFSKPVGDSDFLTLLEKRKNFNK